MNVFEHLDPRQMLWVIDEAPEHAGSGPVHIRSSSPLPFLTTFDR